MTLVRARFRADRLPARTGTGPRPSSSLASRVHDLLALQSVWLGTVIR
jgi:hypothetical protein